MNIRIVTDSTCDLPAEIVGRHAITVIPLAINVGDQSFLDGVDLTRSEFYAQLPTFHPHPTTAAPGTAVFTQTFERLADESAQEEAEALSRQTNAYFPQNEVLITQITPVLGAHLGIGALGFAGVSKE